MPKKFIITCFCITFLQSILITSEAASYFKCKDENGKIIFSDTECPVESEILTEKTLRPNTLTGLSNSQPYLGDDGMSLQEMFELRGDISQAMAAMSPLKNAIAEYYLQEQQWPQQLENLGFTPKQTNSKEIDSVVIGEQGALIAKLRDSLGAGKMVVLKPNEAMDGTLIEWECIANFPELLMKELSCESRNIHP